MAGASVTLSEATLQAIRAHLFPPGNDNEQGGFLLCAIEAAAGRSFVVRDWMPLGRVDYLVQAEDYLELTDEARARIIKQAHATNAALVEVHCHPGPYLACFSPSDMAGLQEFVPHVRWRLKGTPYGALVFSRAAVDGLAWFDATKAAVPVEYLNVDGQRIHTTGLSNRRLSGFQHA